MKKNILFLVVDSLNNTHIKDSEIELMPFFAHLKSIGFSCENMFSEAPYTEAALMNLICGQDVLQDCGYLFRFKNAKKTIFEAMQDKGYHVYTNSYEPQCHPSSVRRGLDDSIYMFGYDPAALWPYRLAHYAELKKQNSLKHEDYEVLIEIISDNLNAWYRWIIEYLHDDYSVGMIKNNAEGYDANSIKKDLECELEKFNRNQVEYIDLILKEGKNHKLFKIPSFKQNSKIQNRVIVDYTRKRFKPIFKRIRKMDFSLNIRNNHDIFKGAFTRFFSFIKHPSKLTFKSFLKASYLSINCLFDTDLYDRLNSNYDSFKDGPSMKTQIDYFLNWAKTYDLNKPYFSYIHVNDAHNPEVFFSYDSSDSALINFEAEEANKILSAIPKDYKGSLTHDLSLKYIDNCFRYLYEKLETFEMLDNLIVVICADHGFSFSGNPIRDSFITNLYLENYNIPFVVTGAGHEGEKIEHFTKSKDIPATICSLVDGIIPKEFTGRNVLIPYEDDNIIEYCGGGCPDIERRELKLAAFNKDYFVGTLGKVDKPVANIITEIYDLSKDPKQMNNLVNSDYDKQTVDRLLEIIKKRKLEIIKTNMV